MNAVPLTQKQAKEYINQNHRHHKASVGDIFRIGCEVDGMLVGVCQCGRPVARHLDDGKTIEVTRLCTDGTYNACSFLYTRAARIAKELGYKRIITYILESETGASLKASGFHFDGYVKGRDWSCESRPRETTAPTCDKQRWARELY